MAPPRHMGHGPKAKNPGKTLLRLLGYMKKYIPLLLCVLVCIVITALASTRGSQSIGQLVDGYILPMVSSGSQDYGPLIRFLFEIAAILLLGMRLGEGSGCPLAFEVLKAACYVINNMATFDEAGIDDGYLEEIRQGDQFTVEGA